jgi:hypothetical protein
MRESIVHSRQTLGAIALGAIVVAAISFAIVDSSIAAANGCMDSAAACQDDSVPVVAVTFAVLGMLALLSSIVPAVTWIVGSIHLHHHASPHSDLELARRHRPRRAQGDDFDA